jgi:hypothetical protein
MNLGSQRIMKMGCVARESLSGLAAQLKEAAIFGSDIQVMLAKKRKIATCWTVRIFMRHVPGGALPR